jgi:hypothetical protein
LNQQAIRQLSAVLEQDPVFPLAHFWLARVYGAENRCPDALAELSSVGPALRDWQPLLAARGNILGTCGQQPDAESILQRFQKLSEGGFVTSYGVALVYAGIRKMPRRSDG